MSRIPSQRIKQFINTFKIERYFDQNSIEYRKTQESDNPQYILKDCPFCKSVNYKGNYHPFRFYMGVSNRLYKCHNCGESGAVISFIAKVDGISIRDVFDKYILGDYVYNLPEKLESHLDDMEKKYEKKNDKVYPVEIPKSFIPIFPTTNVNKDALKYLLNRGINNRSIIEEMNLMFCPSGNGIWSNRLIFPVYFNGSPVGYQGRDITGKSKPKYYISPNFKKSKIIYNYDKVFHADEIVIVEGLFDLMKCWSYNPICLFGATISQAQIDWLVKMPNLKRVILAVDHDTKLDGKLEKLIDKLSPLWNIYSLDIPHDKDAGDMSFSEISSLINNKSPVNTDYIFYLDN